MPSSHSAVVVGLATLIGKDVGVGSPMFALSLVLAFVVMYDAAGVRRAAGKQAKLLNKIVQTPGLTNVEVTEKFIHKLKCKFNRVKIEEIDERLTTVAAHRTMNYLNINKNEKKNIVDTISAVYILETYMNKIKNSI